MSMKLSYEKNTHKGSYLTFKGSASKGIYSLICGVLFLVDIIGLKEDIILPV